MGKKFQAFIWKSLGYTTEAKIWNSYVGELYNMYDLAQIKTNTNSQLGVKETKIFRWFQYVAGLKPLCWKAVVATLDPWI